MRNSRESEVRSSINQELNQLPFGSSGDIMAKAAEDLSTSITSRNSQDFVPRHHLHKKTPRSIVKRLNLNSHNTTVDMSIKIESPIDEDSATEYDIANRMREQDMRFRELRFKDELTPQWIKYAQRRGLR